MTNFEVITPAGVTVHTFNTAEGARKYVLAKKATLPGLRIDAVTVRVERVAVYRPRANRLPTHDLHPELAADLAAGAI